MHPELLVQHGIDRLLGRFRVDPEVADVGRGRAVVVRTRRGLEVGRVLATCSGAGEGGPNPGRGFVVRVAGPEDVEAARRAEAARPGHLALCDRVFRDGTWPIDLIDVEVLPELDGQPPRTVLHYLGPHGLDPGGLSAHFLREHGLEIALEPVGLDEAPIPEPESGCGSGGCGDCGSGGCGSSDDGRKGCSGCDLKAVVRRAVARA